MKHCTLGADKCKICKKQYDAIRYIKQRVKILKQTAVYAKAHPKESCQKVLRFARKHPEIFSTRSANRRAAKLQRTPKWLTEQHKIQIKLFYTAATQLTKELGIKISVDHIVPLQGKNVSGLHVPWNLQVMPLSENSRKNNRLCA